MQGRVLHQVDLSRVEIERILADAGIKGVELLSLSAVPAYDEPVEDGRTFAAFDSRVCEDAFELSELLLVIRGDKELYKPALPYFPR